MKRLYFIIISILLVMSLSAEWIEISRNVSTELFESNSQDLRQAHINFALDGFNREKEMIDGKEFSRVIYENEGKFIQEGKPSLPRFSRFIAIPDQGDVNIEVVNYSKTTISDITVFPQQRLTTESEPKPDEFYLDENYYSNGDIFPSELTFAGEPAIMRDLRVVNVTVNPFQYDPKTKELHIYENVELIVTCSGAGGINQKTRNTAPSRFFQPIYRSSVINYDTIQLRNEEYQAPSYLFIYPNDASLLANLSYLSDWKHQKGFDVKLASTAETGTSTTSIKNYIQNAYDTWENPPEYVCLVGDVGGTYDIPTFYISYYSAEGDHPYSQLEGGDILADVILGRISISSITNMQTYAAKVLYYEKEPYMSETGWYNSALMVGDPSTSGQSTIYTNQSIVDIMEEYAPNIQATEVYSGNYSSSMTTYLNQGVSYFNYRGYYGMSGFNESDIHALSNTKKLPFAVFLTCDTGSFGDSECRSEAFIRAGSAGDPTGAIAAIGTATIGTHTNFNNCIDAGIYYGLFADGINTPGGALNRGKLALFEHYPQNPGGHVDNFSHMNSLMGDPSVELWSRVPISMNAAYETQISPGTNYLEVTVTNTFGGPLEGAWVTALMGDDDIFATGLTDENGYVALEINAQTTGTANLTVTKQNYIPHLGGFTVGTVSNFVNVFDVTIDDDNSGTSNGNNDDTINPGEDIELGVTLKNFGSQTANSISATIATDNDFVTITDASESFGDIAAGATANSLDDFDISIDEDVLGGTEIKLDIEIQNNTRTVWNDIIYLVVEGPNLDIDDYTINDANGYLDPGETVTMSCTLLNNGLTTAGSIYGELTSTDIRVSVSDDIGYFGTISGSGGTASNTSDTFEITANTQTVVGLQIPMNLNLYNADGYDSTVQFLLEIGEITVNDPVGPDSYGYLAYDDGDTDYYSVPIYDWIEINSTGTNLNLNDNGDLGDIATISSLPFTFRMYGEEYTSLTVCSNGWIAPGGATQASFMNSPIPGPQGPSPMIAPFWDDLKTGEVYWHYDSNLNVLIIEWDDMATDQYNHEETFQVIIYDNNFYPSPTGDNDIKFQYKVVHNTSSGSYPSEHGQYSSVGLEDHTAQVGLEYTFNNSYPTAAKQLQDQMAILFTTDDQSPQAEPVLVLYNVNINDSGGNGNADFSETVNLQIELANIGLSDATRINTILSSSNLFVTITQNASSYNDILGGSSGSNLIDYVFDVSSDCVNGTNAFFVLDVSSDEDDWELYFNIELHAPELNIQQSVVDDGDGILSAGETADIRITVINSGGTDAENIIALLSSSDPYLTINDNQDDLSILTPGANDNFFFNVTASASTPIGHAFVCDLYFTADNGFIDSDSFVISPTIFEDNFETDQGWILSGEFERGVPSGSGGTSYGNPDPTSAFEGSYVLGVDLTGLGNRAGDYEPSLGDRAYQAISPAFDCTNYVNVTLEFERWLNIERNQYDDAYIDVYDGSSWHEVWHNSTTTIEDNSWTHYSYDISDYADGSNNVKVRFCIGTTDSGWEYSGWNIDDLLIDGDSKPVISVDQTSYDKSVAPGGSDTDILSISNFGGSTLNYTANVNYIEPVRDDQLEDNEFRDCTFTIELLDTYGDGWNGGSVDLLVNGSAVLNDLTLQTGAGPESHQFTVYTGDMISTNYTEGDWSYENEYYIYDNDGSEVASDGIGGATPSGLAQFAATCTNDPTLAWLTLDGENQVSGSVDAGAASAEIDLLFDTVPDNLEEGTYNANIVLISNDPDNSEVIIQVELLVQASIDIPTNVAIQYSGSNIIVSWSAVNGANSYKVLSSADPELALSSWYLEAEGIATTSWSTSAQTYGKRFYYVVASTENSTLRTYPPANQKKRSRK